MLLIRKANRQVMETLITLEICSTENGPLNESKKNYKIENDPTKLRQKPIFIWVISIVQILVFMFELARNWVLTGNPVEITSSFNPNIGPSLPVLIYMGARFSPCIHGITDQKFYAVLCSNYTNSMEHILCNLNELCGLTAHQWFRFIIPIFLHTGLVHVSLNVLTQLIIGTRIEMKNGTCRAVVVYFISGIFGLILDTNFVHNGFVTVGCSGSLFGLVALHLLNILYDWHHGSCPALLTVMLDVIVTFAIGLLPSISNFNHIGGFVMGLCTSMMVLAQPKRFRSNNWWILRYVVSLIVIGMFIFSVENVYSRKFRCSWCKYLDCLPIQNWCEIGYLIINETVDATLV
ncbi:unnamed protein product [Adineta ricciae]|uniref:rhomboid protease n=1 Tax=Adineta ricciae TaxID=249248 RepID=A0A816CSN4_ADIRI|nr:unnamed protein product [Adineta ricciae]CAF1625713.1 unnamed protein product [Adineta ricciae]